MGSSSLRVKRRWGKKGGETDKGYKWGWGGKKKQQRREKIREC